MQGAVVMHRYARHTVALTAAMVLAASASLAMTAAEAPLVTPPGDPALRWGSCPPVMPAGCELAILHGDPAKANADIFLRVPAGYEIPAHRHTSAERIILTTGQLRVKYQGAAEIMLTPGSYAYGPAGLPHRASCIGDQACTLFIAFVDPVDAEAASLAD